MKWHRAQRKGGQIVELTVGPFALRIRLLRIGQGVSITSLAPLAVAASGILACSRTGRGRGRGVVDGRDGHRNDLFGGAAIAVVDEMVELSEPK